MDLPQSVSLILTHYAYSATHGIHQSFGVGLNEQENRSFAECSSSQRHMESSHNQYETSEDEATFDLCNDAHAQRSDENSEEDEPSEYDGESKLKVNPMKILEIYLKIIVG
ncbi:hypothetical protein KY290_001749 [Solanum tuberosum]|uniref:Uncharacterized protein n=1 Tax=Solanum tuberosum TaxID=4113 RepID=A0ABQ7WN26_SOLTU|nr:hypothetical protein KY290_001749 [Solanum tuberosum]